MALELAHERPHLCVVDGGSPRMRLEEARIEALVAFDEQLTDATRVHDLIAALALEYDGHGRPTDLRFREALLVTGRIGERATRAKAEYLALTAGPEPPAA